MLRADEPLALARSARSREDQQHGALGRGDAEHVRRVDDRDAARARTAAMSMWSKPTLNVPRTFTLSGSLPIVAASKLFGRAA